MNAPDSTSTRPYLIRALYEWCTDNGLTPYVAVSVDDSVQVPREYVKNHEIVLNISFDATSSLKLGNEYIEFKARFAGSARDIMVPISRVIAIYARENGQGMAFPMPGMVQGGTDAGSGLSAIPASDADRHEAPSIASPDDADPKTALKGSTVSEGVLVSVPKSTDSKIVQLVPADSHNAVTEDDKTPPEPPKPKQSGRPSLKRVK
ncbi:MAG: ClpXP protease specificity-enhancing factor [Polaromonas sp.]|jgi:stringent starvation protein B|nr:ClpXP protease specificity-enhancing factor [Polaromonas sp.]